MEVYAIIFLILGSYVLCSSTALFIRWHKDKSDTLEGQIRRIPIIYFQNENSEYKNYKLGTAMGYILPYTESYQVRRTKRDSNYYKSDNNQDIMSSAFKSLNRFRVDSGRNNIFITGRKINPLPSQSIRFLDDSNEKKETNNGLRSMNHFMATKINESLKDTKQNFVDSLPIDGSGVYIPLMRSLLTGKEQGSRGGRSVNPWSRFCSTGHCDSSFKTTTCEVTTCGIDTTCCMDRAGKSFSSLSPEKCFRIRRTSTFLPFLKTTFNTGHNWLFYTHPLQNLANDNSLPAAVEDVTIESKYVKSLVKNSSAVSNTAKVKETECVTVSASSLFTELTGGGSSLLKDLTGSASSVLTELIGNASSVLTKLTGSAGSLLTEERMGGIYSRPVNGSQRNFRFYPNKRSHKRPIKTRHIRSDVKELIKCSFSGENAKKVFKFTVEPYLKPGKRVLKRSAAHVQFFHLNKNANNGSRRHHTCPKTCFYNFTELLNAHKIKPPDYYRNKGPSLILCCPTKEEALTSTNKTLKLGDLATPITPTLKKLNITTVFPPNMTKVSDLRVLDNATAKTEIAAAAGENETVTGLHNITETIGDDIAATSQEDTTEHHLTTHTDHRSENDTRELYKILMKFRDITTTKKRTSPLTTTPKEQFVLKVLVRNNDDSFDSFDLGSERDCNFEGFRWPLKNFFFNNNKKNQKENPFKVYVKEVRRRKKPKPWDKFCPCIDSSTCCTEVTNLDKQPWVSTCCFDLGPVTRKRETEETGSDDDLVVKTLAYPVHSHHALFDKTNWIIESTSEAFRTTQPLYVLLKTSTYKPDIRYVNAKRQEILSILQGSSANKDNLVVLVRVPLSVAQKYSKEGGIKLILPVNNTLLRKYVKPRSILDQLIPSILKKPTTAKHHIAKPWEEPWRFQTSFNLFSSIAPAFGDKRNMGRFKATRNEIISCDESLNDDMLIRSSRSPVIKKFRVGGETYHLYEEADKNSDADENDKCITYLLKFPKEGLTTNVSSVSLIHGKVSQTTPKGVMLLQKFGNPPKYFIEVPDSVGEIIKNAASLSCQTIHHQTKEGKGSEKSSVPEKLNLRTVSQNRTIVLHLQPFEVNGHKVYLPIPNLNRYVKGAVSTSTVEPDDEFADYLETADCSSNKNSHLIGDIFDKNDSSIPFALIPAYLTFHPKARWSYELNVHPQMDTEPAIDKYPGCGSSEDKYCKTKNKLQKPANDSGKIPIEEKWMKLAKQIENTLQNPLPLVRGLSAKHRESSSSRPDGSSEFVHESMPYLVLMKESGEPSVMELPVPPNSKLCHDGKYGFPVIDYKVDVVTVGRMKGPGSPNVH